MKKIQCLFLIVAVIFFFTGCSNSIEIETDLQNTTETTALVEQYETLETTVADKDVSLINKVSSESNQKNTDDVTTTTSALQSVTAKASDNAVLSFSLTINCVNALNYGKRNEVGYDKVIPKNGIIYQNSSLEFEDGENLLKVLKREMKKQGIVLNLNGNYVRGINGLNEFDCGSKSGWLYKVNGNLPGNAINKCILKNECKVEMVYTCDSGDVT